MDLDQELLIIYQAPWNWDHLWNRAQPLASALTMHAKVVYLDLNSCAGGEPGLEELRPNLWRYRWARHFRDAHSGVTKDRPAAAYKALKKALAPLITEHQQKWLITSRPACRELLNLTEWHKCVVDIEDPWLQLPWGAGLLASGDLAVLFGRADLACANGVQLARSFQSLIDKPIFILPNGIDASFAAETRISRAAASPRDRATAVFAGNINDRFDLDALLRIVSDVPEMDFIFAGPLDVGNPAPTAWHSLMAMPNFEYAGVLPYSEVPAFLLRADALLLPYVPRKCGQMFPAKVYEYIATGLPILSSLDFSDYVSIPGLLHYCKSTEDFVSALRRITADRPGPARTLYPEIDRVLDENSWQSRAKELVCKTLNIKAPRGKKPHI